MRIKAPGADGVAREMGDCMLEIPGAVPADGVACPMTDRMIRVASRDEVSAGAIAVNCSFFRPWPCLPFDLDAVRHR